ncbi:MAG: AtpZ/AtpI family protein [Symbiobacteriia bacterium]
MAQQENGESSGSMLSEALTFGGTLAVSSIAGFYLGHYLDGRWGTTPWLMIIFPVVAIVGSIYRFILRLFHN